MLRSGARHIDKENIMSTPNAGITRIHGYAKPETLTGGYQFKFFTVASTVTNFATSATVVGGPFELAVRALEKDATIVLLGTPTAAGFVVAVDGGSVYGRGDSTGYAVEGTQADLQAAVIAATGDTQVVVTAKTLSGVGLA